MKKSIGSYPSVRVGGGGRSVVSQAGAILLVETVRKSGLDTAISTALAPWRKPRAVHDPGKVLLDVALATALGRDCLADVALLRAEPEVFGPVASDPTVSRLIDALAAAGPRALTAIRTARAQVHPQVWELAGANAPAADGSVIVDIDGVLVLTHSEKQDATATWKRPSAIIPTSRSSRSSRSSTTARTGPGSRLPRCCGPGNAGSNTANDHIDTTRLALAQLPKPLPRGRQTLIRTDSAGGAAPTLSSTGSPNPGRWPSYCVGMTISDAIHQAVNKIPKRAWTPAFDAGGTERPGAWVTEITEMPDLSSWPKGMRLVVRKERPHPGAQLRFTGLDGLRLTCFATNTKGGQLADLELRHRRRARCEDRIRNARDTGLRNLPLHDTAQNRIWLEIVSIALDLPAWMPMLALTGDTRRWEPKRLRLHLFFAAARLVNTGRRRWLRFTARWPWTDTITQAIARLQALPNPG
ncbi:IS1380 family transposase [Streptomyces sp. NPDC057717]|uniref:IS1380 family transposase n=1 Tax=Streptomyces sp. NPDC057717 TaxID=3346224 RepID=UPI0036A18456